VVCHTVCFASELTRVASIILLVTILVTGTATLQSASAAGPWKYAANGDYVHVTKGRASGHAWWQWISPGAPPRTAFVSIGLQKYTGARWVAVAVNNHQALLPGDGGSGRRVPVSFPCKGTALTPWRTAIYASVNAQPRDSFNISDDFTTISRRLPCG
jgi:hypothetical protein